MGRFLRDVYGVVYKRIPQYLLRPLPLRTKGLRRSNDGEKECIEIEDDPVSNVEDDRAMVTSLQSIPEASDPLLESETDDTTKASLGSEVSSFEEDVDVPSKKREHERLSVTSKDTSEQSADRASKRKERFMESEDCASDRIGASAEGAGRLSELITAYDDSIEMTRRVSVFETETEDLPVVSIDGIFVSSPMEKEMSMELLSEKSLDQDDGNISNINETSETSSLGDIQGRTSNGNVFFDGDQSELSNEAISKRAQTMSMIPYIRKEIPIMTSHLEQENMTKLAAIGDQPLDAANDPRLGNIPSSEQIGSAEIFDRSITKEEIEMSLFDQQANSFCENVPIEKDACDAISDSQSGTKLTIVESDVLRNDTEFDKTIPSFVSITLDVIDGMVRIKIVSHEQDLEQDTIIEQFLSAIENICDQKLETEDSMDPPLPPPSIDRSVPGLSIELEDDTPIDDIIASPISENVRIEMIIKGNRVYLKIGDSDFFKDPFDSMITIPNEIEKDIQTPFHFANNPSPKSEKIQIALLVEDDRISLQIFNNEVEIESVGDQMDEAVEAMANNHQVLIVASPQIVENEEPLLLEDNIVSNQDPEPRSISKCVISNEDSDVSSNEMESETENQLENDASTKSIARESEESLSSAEKSALQRQDFHFVVDEILENLDIQSVTKCVPVSSTRTNQRSSFQNASEVVPTQSTNEKTSENESSERKNQLAVQFRQVDEVMECFNDRPFPEVDSAPFDQESVQKLTFLGNQLKENLHWIKDRSFTTQEIHEFAEYIGMNVEQDQEDFYIAQWAMAAPIPSEWTTHLDPEGNAYFYHSKTNTPQYEHPKDRQYRLLYQILKQFKTHPQGRI